MGIHFAGQYDNAELMLHEVTCAYVTNFFLIIHRGILLCPHYI